MTIAPLQLLGDERLAQLAAGGDRRAFDVLFERHRRGLERSARSIVGNEHDAQDVLQSTALKAFVGLAARSSGAPLRPWLYRIASNEAITVLRRRRARPADELGELMADAGGGPEELLIVREDLRHLLEDLEHISERQRAALLMRQALGLDYDEIGRRLETSPLAARQCVFSARRALRRSADGREASCATVRVTLAEGDGRALRAAPIRAHLRICPECRAARPPVRRRVASLFPALPSGVLAALRAVVAGPVDPVAAPAKALAVAAVLTVGTGGVARDVREPVRVVAGTTHAKRPAKARAKPTAVARPTAAATPHVARAAVVAVAHTTPAAVTHTVAVGTAPVRRTVRSAPVPTHREPAPQRRPQRRFAEAPRPEPQAEQATARCHHPQPDQPAAAPETSQPVLTAR